MAGLKDQLEAAGYDTSAMDETNVLKQLEGAGYDTSAFAGAPKETRMDKAVRFSKKVTDALSVPLAPVGAAMGAIEQGSEDLSNKLAESGHPILGMHAAGPELLMKGIRKPFEWLDTAGEAVAEKGGEWGVNPELAAGVGTALQMAPDIAMGAQGIAKRAMLANLAKGGLKAVGKVAGAPVRAAKELAFAPTAEEVAALGKEKLVNVAERGADKLSLARETEAAAKQGLIGAEEKAGLHFESTPEFEEFIANPKKLSGFSQKASRLSKLGPEQLAQTVEPRVLQTFRKIAQEGEKVTNLSDIAKAQMREAKDVFTQALGKSEPGIGTELERFREAGKVVKELPSELKGRLQSQKLHTEADKLHAKKIERTRKLVKAALMGTGTYLGVKSIFH